ncbi:MAG: nucleotidyltransferase family protein [Elusimicrobia bacterium]|nr:nucleotidyltransferase family protein [Elusimicrobiota bacterium]
MRRSLRETQVFLLAAGRGERAGGPKAWRDVDGRPALFGHLANIIGAVASVTVSVQAEWLPRCKEHAPAAYWVATDPDLPPLASLQALVAYRPSDAPGFVYHVDMPCYGRPVYRALLEGLRGADAAAPVVDGKRGHPVLLAPGLYDALLALDPATDRLDAFLRTREVREIPMTTGEVLENRNRS